MKKSGKERSNKVGFCAGMFSGFEGGIFSMEVCSGWLEAGDSPDKGGCEKRRKLRDSWL